MERGLIYYKSQLLMVRSLIDDLLREMDEELVVNAASKVPQKRPTARQERIAQYERNIIMGKWSKPPSIKKAK
jgi:hypothetical protein